MASTTTPTKSATTLLSVTTLAPAAADLTSAAWDVRSVLGPVLWVVATATDPANPPTSWPQVTLEVSDDGTTWRPYETLMLNPDVGQTTKAAAPVDLPEATLYARATFAAPVGFSADVSAVGNSFVLTSA